MSPQRTINEQLRSAEWLMRPETQRLLAMLDGAQRRTRAVGGIVRDTLLGVAHQGNDVDFATELTPDEVAHRASRGGAAVHPTGIEHGTLTLRLDNLVAEVTTLRRDIETDGRRAVVAFGTDWHEDAARRDFTLNALYAEMDGGLFDPLGGVADCLARRVRFIGRPEQRIEEDRLRVYRFFRFSASHAAERFDVAGLRACVAAAGTLDNLAAERVGTEMRRMLALPRVAKTLTAMKSASILDLPATTLDRLHVYERRVRRPEYSARLAIILAQTDTAWLRERWRLPNEDLRVAAAIQAAAGLLADFSLNEAAYRYPAALSDAVEVAAVLHQWTEAGRLAVREQLERVEVQRFPIGGADLIERGIRPGPLLGSELERLERMWIESAFSLDRDALLTAIRRTD
ncbi:MAG: CCA tRNA nucleotidyltransferase [Devosia sp.]|nr:CCA tRNA nucleotidyltransferase [Devosia sp.]